MEEMVVMNEVTENTEVNEVETNEPENNWGPVAIIFGGGALLGGLAVKFGGKGIKWAKNKISTHKATKEAKKAEKTKSDEKPDENE